MRFHKIILILFTGVIIFLLQECHFTNRKETGKQIKNTDQVIGNDDNKEAKEIIIYGSKTCPHCIAFIRKMDREGISYSFKEVDNDDGNYQEMFDKIRSIHYKGYVNYPVVDIGGEILVAPTYDQFYSFYNQ